MAAVAQIRKRGSHLSIRTTQSEKWKNMPTGDVIEIGGHIGLVVKMKRNRCSVSAYQLRGDSNGPLWKKNIGDGTYNVGMRAMQRL